MGWHQDHGFALQAKAMVKMGRNNLELLSMATTNAVKGYVNHGLDNERL